MLTIVQSTYEGVSKSISGQCVESLDSGLATQIDLAQALAPVPVQPSLGFNPLLAMSELRDQKEVRINEGGAGDEASA